MAVTFQGGQALPSVGTPAYTAAQQGIGQGFYNPSTGNLVSSQGGTIYSPTGSSTAQTPPPTPSTTMDASRLSSNNSALAVPDQPQSTNPTAFVSSLTPGAKPEMTAGSQPGQSSDWRNQFMSTYLGMVNQAGNEGGAYQSALNNMGVPAITQNLANVRGLIAQRTAAYMSQWNQANGENAAMPYIAGEQTQIQRTQAIEIGMLTAQEQALSGNLQAAQSIVDATIQHEFEPVKTQLAAMQSFYQMNKNDLTDSESLQLQQNYDLQKTNYQNFLQLKSSAYNTALQYGNGQMISALSQAQTPQDLWNAMSGILPSGSTSTNGGSIVNGYDLSTYATDPNYASKITASSTAIGQISSVADADAMIQKIAPNSPITGQMIANAASEFKVDPNTLMSVMAVESKFGTAGLGAKTTNPGNVGNTDSGATQKFATWQDGVNAVAQQLANRRVNVSDAVTGNTQSAQRTSLVNSAPLLVRPAIRFTNDGTAYIDSTRLNSTSGINTTAMAQTFSATHGNIPILDDADAKAVQTIEQSKQSLQTIANNFYKLAPSGTSIFSKFGFVASADLGMLKGNQFSSDVKAYNHNRDSLLQTVRALAGMSPRLNQNELNIAANSLPQLSGSSIDIDSIQDGESKLQLTGQYLDNALKTILPNYNGSSDYSYQNTQGIKQPQTQSQSNIVTAPDGKQIQIID